MALERAGLCTRRSANMPSWWTAHRGIPVCVTEGDNGSRELLERILAGEEEHADRLEAQLTLIDQVGEGNYLAQQIG